MAHWIHDGSRVYNGVAPVAWTDLDLKAVAGGGSTAHPSARTLTLLKVENSSGSPYITFRVNGDTRDNYSAAFFDHGCCVIDIQSTVSEACTVFLPTDSTGVIEWRASSAESVEIWLLGFVEASSVDLTVRADGALPAVWTSLDLTQDTVATPTGLTSEALAYLWFDRSGGTTNEIALRPTVPGSANYNVADSIGGVSQGRPTAAGKSEGLVIKTDSSGECELIGETVVPNGSLDLAMYEEEGFQDFNQEVYASAPPPTIWTTLDLSTWVVARKALVMIDVHLKNENPGPVQSVAVRTTGDTSEYIAGSDQEPAGVARCAMYEDDRAILLVETNSAGTIQWRSSSTTREVDLRLIGCVGEYSEIALVDYGPTDVITGAMDPIHALITDEIGLLTATLTIRAVQDIGLPMTIYTSSAFQPGWSGTIVGTDLSGGNPRRLDIRVDTFHPDFLASSPQRWTIEISIDNSTGDSL